jgi:calcineurin-like phosphoesterase family protein
VPGQGSNGYAPVKIYVTSDTHLGHDKLSTPGMGNRPLGFSETILANLSRLRGDVLIHCGDICIGRDEEWHQRLARAAAGFPHRVLVRGNHDRKSDAWYLSRGWTFICSRFVNTYFGRQVIFTHEPLSVAGRGTFDRNIHGHLHGKGQASHRLIEGDIYDGRFHLDVGVDAHGLCPVELKFLL